MRSGAGDNQLATAWEAKVEEHRNALLASATPVESIGAMEVTEVVTHEGASDVRVIGQPAWRRNKAVYLRRRGR